MLRTHAVHSRELRAASERSLERASGRTRLAVHESAHRLATSVGLRASRRTAQVFCFLALRHHAREQRAKRGGVGVHFAAKTLERAEGERREAERAYAMAVRQREDAYRAVASSSLAGSSVGGSLAPSVPPSVVPSPLPRPPGVPPPVRTADSDTFGSQQPSPAGTSAAAEVATLRAALEVERQRSAALEAERKQHSLKRPVPRPSLVLLLSP
jgi:hypothetical protein